MYRERVGREGGKEGESRESKTNRSGRYRCRLFVCCCLCHCFSPIASLATHPEQHPTTIGVAKVVQFQPSRGVILRHQSFDWTISEYCPIK